MIDYNPEGIKGVVSITQDDLYVKTPKSLTALVDHLTKVGYKIKDVSSEKNVSGEKPPRNVQEREGWMLWYGKLSEEILQRKGECGSCHNLIDTKGIQIHEHECEVCGDYTYVEYVNGGEISFSVVDDPNPGIKNLTFVIHSYDKDNEKLNLYVNSEDCLERKSRNIRNFGYTPEECREMVPHLIEKFPETFELKEIDGVGIISVNYKDDSRVHEHSIDTSEIQGDTRNFEIFNIFKGKKFSDFDRLPIPESVQIYEAWHWAPLEPGPGVYERIMSAAGLVSDKSRHHQDGRPGYNQIQVDRVLKFIDKLTTIDVKMVKPYLNPKLSGPDFIDVLATLTGHEGRIDTDPNIGNALMFFGQYLEGKRNFTPEEIREAIKGAGLDDPKNVLGRVLGNDLINRVFEAYDGPLPFPGSERKKRR